MSTEKKTEPSEVEMTYREYKFLRDEIMQYIGMRNQLTTFAVTAVLAILTFALSIENASAYTALLSYLLIIPLSFRVIYYSFACMRISGYMIYLESKMPGINWESINNQAMPKFKASKENPLWKFSLSIRYHEFTALSIATTIVFFVRYYENAPLWNAQGIFFLIVPLLLDVFVWWATIKGQQSDKMRSEAMVHWEEVIHNYENK